MHYRRLFLFFFLVVGFARSGGAQEDIAVLRSAELLATQKEKVEEALISIVNSSGAAASSLEAKRNAIRLLGRIGGARSIPVLIENISRTFADEVDVVDHNDIGEIPPTPGMQSLVCLGALSIAPLFDAIAVEQHPVLLRDKQQTLALLACRKLVRAGLEQRVAEERDENVRTRLRQTLTYLRE